jgi:hypothetical protein
VLIRCNRRGRACQLAVALAVAAGAVERGVVARRAGRADAEDNGLVSSAVELAGDYVDPRLADAIRGGASLLPRMRIAIDRCRTEPSPKGDLARECGDLVQAYTALSERVRQLPRTELGAQVDRLLSCQLQIAGNAAYLAFRIHDENWAALAARFGDGGVVGDELLYLAAAVSRV